jgi:phytoene dehydrogenase-like protein
MPESDVSVDVIVIGAGHNALITAGYLAKAGLEVAVLEANSIIGGNTVTEELTLPGWQHDSCSSAHAVIQSNPVIRDDDAHRRWNAGLPIGEDEGAIAYDALRRQSAWDVVHKEFEHEVTRRVLLWMGFANFQPPTRGGTGALPVSITNGRLEFGWATPIGGSGALPAALAALIADRGGHVMVDSAVSRILVSQGRADGVETHDGRRIRARVAVVSSAHLATLPEMLGAEAPEDLTAAAAAWRPGIALFAVHAALRQDIRYRVAGRPITSTSGGLGSPNGIRRQVAGCSTGEPEMDDPWMLMVSSTAVDPDRAPGGTLKILTCAPQSLASGESWESFGSRYAQRLLALAGRHVDGLGEADVLAVVPETPASLARRNPHNIGGSCHGGEFLLPSGEYVPGWPGHASSLERLFLTGSTAHPGGSVSGWPGRNAARGSFSRRHRPGHGHGGLVMVSLAPLRLGLFSPSLPHLVAIREGYYEERGVIVEQQRIPSSAALLRALRDGDLDVALTSPDNIANFRLNKAGDGPLDARIIAAVLAARGEYLDQSPGLVSRFVSGFRQAMSYCLDPARHADCTDLVVSEWRVDPDVAARMVDAAADARTGVVPDAVITPARLEVVLELRKRWGGFSQDVDIAAEIRRPRGLIDERFGSMG